MKQICILCAGDSLPKNTIRDGGSTALYAAYTVDTNDMVYTVDMDYTFNMVTLFTRYKILNHLDTLLNYLGIRLS